MATGRDWQWPAGMGSGDQAFTSSFDASHNTQYFDERTPDPEPTPKRKHYKPRTCRICLEVVYPTTDLDDSVAAGLFSSRARVTYVSEDPELGRLISPCLCKGTQQYVHEGCLQAWRQASPLSDRNFWRCPTCQFEYRLSRIKYGRWLSSKPLRAVLTLGILIVTVFFLGFVADPIINLWIDPLGSITDTIADVISVEPLHPTDDDEPVTWSFHFVKGFLSLGLLGFLKTFFAMSPWHWFNIRLGTGRRRGTGRDRMESINWGLVIIGVFTFLGATWKLVSHFSAKALESLGDRVIDVQRDEPDEDEDDVDQAADDADGESSKDR
ncbi:E3 ubiquitin-protein ligase MARCH9 [Echria macrotheca]|uniref:E3 ubiquitin-protein ligase MARCH9 n=1 Tax=Echria macrotheca TaxID=438768 RepID=A0AAJ0BEX0_9PEZI|nr:E3 ubiquitin-protein ligase MARCH9 [Echria macrotheca]